ncbi:6-carboxyhexanoate--CoA ligase [Corynebacterium ciconiae DSM 44920]|uniref:6-carboxyhexanoate--CoA ligase n=1 Tax=Corynebacterium ciconiae TaxID=227319 RepID=UPI00037F33E4|nr:6-carboxyhexanoate--CoA ligase [Corynebacterium ciconiae]WKD60381.1 6-carboxyhexanoate--CoA ligase [Corynebacterium ciconiae DSM 44920]
MGYYSIKMHASAQGQHISGAERILPEEQLAEMAAILTTRALRHPKGRAADISLRATAIADDQILRVPALATTTIATANPDEADAVIADILAEIGVGSPYPCVRLLREVSGLRGAMIVDADTAARLEPDPHRGVRVSTFDSSCSSLSADKEHYREALTLASKALSAPGIVAELCMSDDPDYTTGYIATAGQYRRLLNMKQQGSTRGTRVLIYRGTREDLSATINYLENIPVLVEL